MLLLLVVEDVLGAGIYALVGEVGARVGGAIWTSFLLALVLALFTACAYAELADAVRTFLVAFAVMSSGLTSAATLSRDFGGDYLSVFVEAPTVLVGIVFIALVTAVNFRGITESARLNVVLTSIEVTGLFLVVWSAWLRSPTAVRQSTRPGRSTSRTGKTSSRASWPRRAGHCSRSWSSGPCLPTKLFSAIALSALANGALINMIMASRVVYGMSREHILPPALGMVHGGRKTPWVAILVTTAITMVLIASGDLSDVADTTVLLLLFVFTAVNIAVLALLGACVSVALMTTDAETFLRAGVLLLVGTALWALNRLPGGHADDDLNQAN